MPKYLQRLLRGFTLQKKKTSAERLFAFPVFQDYRPISSAEYLFGFPIFQVAFLSFKKRQLNFCSGTCYLYPTGAGSIPGLNDGYNNGQATHASRLGQKLCSPAGVYSAF